MDERQIVIAVVILAGLWLLPGFRWRAKAGASALVVLAVIVELAAPGTLGGLVAEMLD